MKFLSWFYFSQVLQVGAAGSRSKSSCWYNWSFHWWHWSSWHLFLHSTWNWAGMAKDWWKGICSSIHQDFIPINWLISVCSSWLQSWLLETTFIILGFTWVTGWYVQLRCGFLWTLAPVRNINGETYCFIWFETERRTASWLGCWVSRTGILVEAVNVPKSIWSSICHCTFKACISSTHGIWVIRWQVMVTFTVHSTTFSCFKSISMHALIITHQIEERTKIVDQIHESSMKLFPTLCNSKTSICIHLLNFPLCCCRIPV